MEKTYTIENIKKYFDYLKKEYPNSGILRHVESIEFMMFDKDSLNNFEKIIETLDKDI